MATASTGQQAQVETAPAETQESPGFAGNLRCASLADLVQLQCLSRVRSAVTVNSAGRSGQLYFDAGEIVHAATQWLVGEEAALEILNWEGGSFGMVDLEWPTARTLQLPWQHLLLLAAQRQDEMGRNSTRISAKRAASPVETSVVQPRLGTPRNAPPPLPPPAPRTISLPRPSGERVSVSGISVSGASLSRAGVSSVSGGVVPGSVVPSSGVKAVPPLPRAPMAPEFSPSPRAPVAEALPLPPAELSVPSDPLPQAPPAAAFLGLAPQVAAELLSAARFDAAGQVIESCGDPRGLTSLCGFLRRIVDWVGDDLGLTGFRCFEGRSSARQVLLYTEAAGSLVALELSTNADLASLRSALAEMG